MYNYYRIVNANEVHAESSAEEYLTSVPSCKVTTFRNTAAGYHTLCNGI